MKTSTLWMLPPWEAMQSEIRDGELRAEARGVESVRERWEMEAGVIWMGYLRA